MERNIIIWLSALEKGVALYLNKLEFPSPKDALTQIWLKLAKQFWRRKFLNFVNVFLLNCNYLPLEKSVGLHLNKLEYPLPKDTLWAIGWNWLRGSREEDKNVKSLQTDRWTTDNKRSEKLTRAFSSGELKKVGLPPPLHQIRHLCNSICIYSF